MYGKPAGAGSVTETSSGPMFDRAFKAVSTAAVVASKAIGAVVWAPKVSVYVPPVASTVSCCSSLVPGRPHSRTPSAATVHATSPPNTLGMAAPALGANTSEPATTDMTTTALRIL